MEWISHLTLRNTQGGLSFLRTPGEVAEFYYTSGKCSKNFLCPISTNLRGFISYLATSVSRLAALWRQLGIAPLWTELTLTKEWSDNLSFGFRQGTGTLWREKEGRIFLEVIL